MVWKIFIKYNGRNGRYWSVNHNESKTNSGRIGDPGEEKVSEAAYYLPQRERRATVDYGFLFYKESNQSFIPYSEDEAAKAFWQANINRVVQPTPRVPRASGVSGSTPSISINRNVPEYKTNKDGYIVKYRDGYVRPSDFSITSDLNLSKFNYKRLSYMSDSEKSKAKIFWEGISATVLPFTNKPDFENLASSSFGTMYFVLDETQFIGVLHLTGSSSYEQNNFIYLKSEYITKENLLIILCETTRYLKSNFSKEEYKFKSKIVKINDILTNILNYTSGNETIIFTVNFSDLRSQKRNINMEW